jgi:hypothetical protein
VSIAGWLTWSSAITHPSGLTLLSSDSDKGLCKADTDSDKYS